MRSKRFLSSLTALSLAGIAADAAAAPQLRFQIDQAGDFVLIGNTLAQECASGGTPAVPAPVVGSLTCNAQNEGDSSPDVFWRADAPAANQAQANASITADQARSTSVMAVPAGAVISYARLYWAGYLASGGADTTARIERPSSGLNTLVTADASYTQPVDGNLWYQSTADVTALVKAQGPGPFRVGNVSAVALPTFNSPNPVVAWSMVIFYELASEPPRNLALFDGFDQVSSGNPQTVTLTGFLVPNAGFDAKLGVVTYEGEADLTGDSLIFNGTTLSNAINPATNFFNGSRSRLGVAVSTVGDLPQLTGGPRSMSGIDLDVVDVSPQVSAGQTSATITADSSQDRYLLAAFVTSISTFKPNFETSNKTFVDLNGGAIRPGDEIEYTINVTNTGNDVSVDTRLTDALPAGVTFIPGSIEIVSGPNAGPKTDQSGDDQADYAAATRTVTARLGVAANATQGGRLAIGETTVVKFKVSIDANASGTIENQAIVRGGGQKGAPPSDYPTDGNGNAPGTPPTDFPIDQCATDTDCTTAALPHCNVGSSPKICVECVTSSHCTISAEPDCNPSTHTCECATGAGTCQDTDGDGLSDGNETNIGTDPNDADSDDDGVIDGEELNPGTDSDADGLINALDPDSDDDGLFDGTEMGKGCSNPATDLGKGDCRADADTGTTTDPLDADTDNGGVTDGSEDSNLDGKLDTGESNPTSGNAADDAGVTDTDGDGLGDGLEGFLGSNPNDADSDDDGSRDGDENNPSSDTDDDGLVNVRDVDSDDDALFDGTEQGKDCDDPATDKTKNHCRADNDGGASKTSAVDPDTDGGGVRDGSEDTNLNGIVDSGERNPTPGNGGDDNGVTDTDADGLSDGLETTLGTNPNDADSDDDGALDGEEPNPSDDHDGDGKLNPLDEDSDGDGLFDGTELGNGCANAATDASKNVCRADGDSGSTKTSAVDRDTDRGGVADGTEDTDKDGVVDVGERDPNDPLDDTIGEDCVADTDCGGPQSGIVCGAAGKCTPGCRGTGGNGCPNGEVCTSTTDAIGECIGPSDGGTDGSAGTDGGTATGGSAGTGTGGNAATGGSGTGGSATGGANTGGVTAAGGTGAAAADDVDGVLEGGGCACSTVTTEQRSFAALLLFGLLGACAGGRRRRRG